MSDLPSYDLELKAAEDRQHLHKSVEQLRSQLRDRLDLQKNVRNHLLGVCSVAMVVGLAAGYGVTSIFLHRPGATR